MACLRLILADQLSMSLPIIEQADKSSDVFLLCEVHGEASYVKHHKKKIAFLFAAMRHFAQSLKEQGYKVEYVDYLNADNTHSLDSEIQRFVEKYQPDKVVMTRSGEYRSEESFDALAKQLPIPLERLEDTRFLCSHEEFDAWAAGKKEWRMEFFYRQMRKKHHILMVADGKSPVGGKWNYDKENRKPPVKGLRSAPRLSHKKSKILLEVLALVNEKFVDHIGTLEPFHYAVTREQALLELDDFIDNILPDFGDYQDAMVQGEPYLYHSLLSSYLNAGLLLPLEICVKAQDAYHQGKVPLNAAEGFIRQILGWREYIRGIYWHFMPQYAERNTLNAQEPLPALYWNANTKMACMKEAVEHTIEHAYSHHIQRLMITGNFALLAGLNPAEVCEWYLAVYSDAYEWVELPNTLGMALYGDDAVVASKPYAASGQYIKRMSNYCDGCAYSVKKTTEEDACPFNALYWNFMARHEERFRGHPRMPFVYQTWDKMRAEKQRAIRARSQNILAKLREGSL